MHFALSWQQRKDLHSVDDRMCVCVKVSVNGGVNICVNVLENYYQIIIDKYFLLFKDVSIVFML